MINGNFYTTLPNVKFIASLLGCIQAYNQDVVLFYKRQYLLEFYFTDMKIIIFEWFSTACKLF